MRLKTQQECKMNSKQTGHEMKHKDEKGKETKSRHQKKDVMIEKDGGNRWRSDREMVAFQVDKV